MNRVKFLHMFFFVAVMQNVVYCENDEPFGPALPHDTVFQLVTASFFTSLFVADERRRTEEVETEEECKQLAMTEGAHFFMIKFDICFYGTLLYPICSNENGSYAELHVDEKFVTDGSPSDYAIVEPDIFFVGRAQGRSFRVDKPTILEIPGFTVDNAGEEGYVNKLIAAHGNKALETDGHYLIDPACYTNSSCAIAMFTTALELDTRYVVLHDVCGQTIDIGSEPGINVLSHEGIGCKFFPDDYPVSNCEVTISGSDTLKVNATLVNFRETTCDGSELVVDTPASDGTTNAVDVCTENAPTEFTAEAGEVKISFSASAGQTGQKYGFIIIITK